MSSVDLFGPWITLEEIRQMTHEEQTTMLGQLIEMSDQAEKEIERWTRIKSRFDEQIQDIVAVPTTNADVPHYIRSSRFKGMNQLEACVTIFREQNNKPLTALELAKEVVANGYEGRGGERRPEKIEASIASLLSARTDSFMKAQERGRWILKDFQANAQETT